MIERPFNRPLQMAKRTLYLTSLIALLPLVSQEVCDDAYADIEAESVWTESTAEAIAEEAEESVEDNEAPLHLNLPTAISMALQANRGIANAADSVQKAQLNLNLSESAFDIKFTPSCDVGYIGGGDAGMGATVGGSLEICKKFSFGTRVSLRPYATKDAHHYHSGVKAKIIQPLLRGFGREYTLAPVYAAQFSSRSAYRNAYLSGVEMVSRLIHAMYGVMRLEMLLRINQEGQIRLQHFYAAIKVKERIGMADSLDVYRTETELKSGEDHLNTLLEQLQDAQDKLREILALPLGRNLQIDLSLDYSPFETDTEKAIEAALQNRIEISQADDRWRENQRLSSLAKKNLLPNLDLVLDFSNIGRDEVFTRSFTTERDSRWGVGFMTANDWDRTAQEVAYQQSLLAVGHAERSFEQAQDSVILDVKRSVRTLKRAGQRIALQEKQIHSSEGGLRLAKIKFDRGLANNFDVIQAEKTLRNAKAAHLSATIEHKVGEYKFLASIGLLVDKPQFCQ